MTTRSLPPDELLTTTRSVRKRLDLTRPVPLELVKESLEVALQAPTGGNSQGWHWMVVTDLDLRAGLGDYYRRSFEAYRDGARRAAAAYDDADRRATQARVGSSAQYLADHMGEVPVLVLACIEAGADLPAENQAGLWGSLLPAAWSYQARRPCPRPRHGVDDTAPALRARGRRAARHPAARAAGRAPPDGVLHGRDVPAGVARTVGDRAPPGPLVAVRRCGL